MSDSTVMKAVLVTGAGGNVGAPLVSLLAEKGVPVTAGLRSPKGNSPQGVKEVRFDFTDPSTYTAALEGVNRVFLMRPPSVADIDRDMMPFLHAMQEAGIEQVVLMSLQGAEKRGYLPHRKMEIALQDMGMPYTFLRPSFFMQNLTTTHREEIRDTDRIFVPAGNGKTNFIDSRDIAKAAYVVFTTPGHIGKAYTLTGPDNLDYYEIARSLSSVLNREIVYDRPGFIRFFLHHRKNGTAAMFILIMCFLYGQTRFGAKPWKSPDLARLLAAIGERPVNINEFAEEHKGIWERV
ncbi:MAG: NmrA family NAD(P)-binding protein [Spirochaeta sp.]